MASPNRRICPGSRSRALRSWVSWASRLRTTSWPGSTGAKRTSSDGVARSYPPDAHAAVPATPSIAANAFRTIAPHETGGNIDIKQLTVGATLYLPVYQPGGLFSVGDAHFAQGDGESCGTAVETSANFVAKFEVLKGEATRRRQNDPSFEHSEYFAHPSMAVPRRFYATTGIPVSRDGLRNESEDLSMAARNALLNMIDYLMDTRGLTRQQAYCLTSVAVDLKVSQVVDVPNLIVSAFLPLDIFDT